MSTFHAGPTVIDAAIGALLFLGAALAPGCTHDAANPATRDTNKGDAVTGDQHGQHAGSGDAPALVLGSFEDDYAITYTITKTAWQQHPAPPLSVVEWDSAARYVIVRNTPNDSLPGPRFTRIDWLALDGFPPYTWAYCYTVYDAEDVTSARNVDPPQRDTPRSGCNGFPFSRMKAR